MRPTHLAPALALCFLLAAPAAADPIALTAEDVTTHLRPVAAEIQHCYLDRASTIRGAGKLSLQLTVARSGELRELAVKTPGLPTRLATQIDGCIRGAVATVSFPARRTWTTATVPYFFQHTAAPGAGPQLGCFSATGCH